MTRMVRRGRPWQEISHSSSVPEGKTIGLEIQTRLGFEPATEGVARGSAYSGNLDRWVSGSWAIMPRTSAIASLVPRRARVIKPPFAPSLFPCSQQRSISASSANSLSSSLCKSSIADIPPRNESVVARSVNFQRTSLFRPDDDGLLDKGH